MFAFLSRERVTEKIATVFDELYAQLQGFLYAQHGPEGVHTAVTADSVTSTLGYTERARSVAMGEWQDFTPVWTGSSSDPVIGDGTIEGRYTRVGKTVFFVIEVVMGSTTTFGSGTWLFDYPTTKNTLVSDPLQTFQGYDAGSFTFYEGVCSPSSTGKIAMLTGGIVTPTHPITWANTDIIRVTGFYEEE